MDTKKRYEVALSFSGKQREYVEEVARHLRARGIDLFYDGFSAVDLWGSDGADTFRRVFSEQAAHVVIFISKSYIDGYWTNIERRSTFGRWSYDQAEFVIPVRFDDTEVPELSPDCLYERAENRTPAELADLISRKCGVPQYSGKASHVAAPRMTSPVGEVDFDYSSYNGRHVVGTNDFELETRWGQCGDDSIYIYNSPGTVFGVALAEECQSIGEVCGAATFDYTSCTRQVFVGEVVVLQSKKGFYAAVQILNVERRLQAGGKNHLRFRYAIQRDGSDSFKCFARVEEQ